MKDKVSLHEVAFRRKRARKARNWNVISAQFYSTNALNSVVYPPPNASLCQLVIIIIISKVLLLSANTPRVYFAFETELRILESSSEN